MAQVDIIIHGDRTMLIREGGQVVKYPASKHVKPLAMLRKCWRGKAKVTIVEIHLVKAKGKRPEMKIQPMTRLMRKLDLYTKALSCHFRL